MMKLQLLCLLFVVTVTSAIEFSCDNVPTARTLRHDTAMLDISRSGEFFTPGEKFTGKRAHD